jgi:hypothetical protein
MRNRIFAAIAATVALAGPASAADLFTPTLFAGGPNSQNICVVTNVGTSPITVTVTMVPFDDDPTSETCTIEPGDPSGCQNSANTLAYCRVSVQGSTKRVRGVMMNRSIVSPFTIHTSVEAR